LLSNEHDYPVVQSRGTEEELEVESTVCLLTALADARASGGDGEPGAAHGRDHPRAPPRHDARPYLLLLLL
jgi:hypothetical protein